ncbi:MAG TPA: LysE family transporter, partial [Azospirillaceae bacterium]|nr:LysE family transporter [Azospirillaceae bacterium]
MTDPILFLTAVMLVLLTPGPTNTLLAAAGAAGGAKAGWRLPLMEAAAYLVSVSLLGWGIGPVAEAVPALKTALRLAAGLYLAYVAFTLWRSGVATLGERRAVGPAQVFTATLLNPKCLIFAFGLVPMDHPAAALYLAAFAGCVLTAGTGWLLLGAALRRGLSP